MDHHIVLWRMKLDLQSMTQINFWVCMIGLKNETFWFQESISTDWEVLGGKKWNYLFTSTLICHPKKIFNLVKANLLTPEATDRSGVASISVMNHMKEKLKGYHSRHLATTSDMCWTIWANDILRQPAHVHQSLIERGLQVILFIFSAQ